MDMEPFSLVDYPGQIAAVVFFAGCNFRCGYCHNPVLVKAEEKPRTSPSAVLEFLAGRKGLLDGVCFSGGEPLLSPDLLELARGVKKLGYKLKLDTNGSSLDKLREVSVYLDYVAMDVKATPAKYKEITGCPDCWPKVKATLEWLKKSGISYEFRTTVVPAWHSLEDLREIRALLGESTPWVLQQFRQPPGGVLDGKTYEIYPDSWLKEVGCELHCEVRGLN